MRDAQAKAPDELVEFVRSLKLMVAQRMVRGSTVLSNRQPVVGNLCGRLWGRFVNRPS